MQNLGGEMVLGVIVATIMLLEEFKQKYILCDGQVVSLACDFGQRQVQVQLNVRKWNGKSPEPYTLDIVFKDVTEIDLLANFDVSSYSDVVFAKTNAGNYYASFDPFNNTGQPNENDNFIIKSNEVVFFDGDEWVKLT